MAIIDVDFVAFMSDPKFTEEASTKLMKEQSSAGKESIMENLHSEGLTSYVMYLEKRGIFKMLFKKKYTNNPRAF